MKPQLTYLILAFLSLAKKQSLFVCSVKNFVITGFFDENEKLPEKTFAFAAEYFNRKYKNIQIQPMFVDVNVADTYQTAQKACDMLMAKSVAFLGPVSGPGSAQIQSLADLKEIPHFMTSMSDSRPPFFQTSFTLYPPAQLIGAAIASLVKYYRWQSFLILYESDYGLAQIQDVLLRLDSKTKVTFRKLPPHGRFLELLKEIKEVIEESQIIIQAGLKTSRLFLEQSIGMKLVAEYYHFIFTDLDIFTMDLEPYKKSCQSCNISGLRIVQMNDQTNSLRTRLERYAPQMLPIVGIPTVVAVIFDSVLVLAQALDQQVDYLEPESVSCQSDNTWSHGSSLVNSLKMMQTNGSTGRISFDSLARRNSYEFSIIELTKKGFEELGRWNESHELQVTQKHDASLKDIELSLRNKTLRVTVILEEPFVMLKETDKPLTGNDRFEGYCIDLLEEISNLLKFNYTIHEVADKSYGSKDEKGRWNGLVGELVRKEADLAVASLTISYSRSEDIAFTVPYMHLGISILFKKPEKRDPSLFTFLSPLSLDVWIYMLAAYLGVSLTLWILARFSPYEWYNPHPCDKDADVVENQFSLLNSLWFTVGSLMQQGCDIAPKAASTRLVAGFWWFFTLILISSYTANLAAFLTVERMVSPIESADDLAKQTTIKYGTLNRGSTMTFFKESAIQTYARMWAFMESAQPSVFVNGSREAIQRVKGLKGNEQYAYLMESSMLEYYIERDCELMQIGGLLDSKGYGFGLPKGSIYRDPISSAILMLQEKTKLTALKERWWKQKRGGGQCKGSTDAKGKANELGLPSVGGVFVFLLCGLVLSFIISILEFVYKASHNQQHKGSIMSEMWSELKFAFRCHGSKKPAYKKTRPPPYSSSTAVGFHSSAGSTTAFNSFVPAGYSSHKDYDLVPTHPLNQTAQNAETRRSVTRFRHCEDSSEG